MLTDGKPADLAEVNQDSASAIDKLIGIVGESHVLLSSADREFYSMDVRRAQKLPLAVIQPADVEQLAAVVKTASENRLDIVPRGGGASYTDAYVATSEQSILLDTSRLDRIVSINDEDMYVTVECGVTWARLDEELKKRGLRTPFWGPFSGQKATVGGSTAQGTVSMGSGAYGTSAESVVGFEIILANGELLKTGSHAAANGTPFFRNYGPDLTGLFTNDAGAMGIKARITLRLIKRPTFNGACSFGFADFDAMSEALAAAAREDVADLNMAIDPGLQQNQLTKTTASDAIQAALAVFRSSRNIFDGIWSLVKLAAAGKRFFGSHPYSAHFVVDGHSPSVVKAKLALLRKAAKSFGSEISASVPTVLAAMPFIPLHGILGPRGERCLPMHGILPFSKVKEFNRNLKSLLTEKAQQLKDNKIHIAEMYTTIGNHGFLYEPVFYWEDSRTAYVDRYMDDEYLSTLEIFEDNPGARDLVENIYASILDLFRDAGAIHLQIGKTYPYLRDRQPVAADLMSEIKRAVDPDTIMNPGALDGLNAN